MLMLPVCWGGDYKTMVVIELHDVSSCDVG